MPCFWYRAARRNKLHLHLPWHCSVCSWVWVSSIPTIPPAEQFLALLWDQMLQDAKAGCPIWAILFSISAAFRHPLQLSCRAWLDQPSKELLLLLKKEHLREYRSMLNHTQMLPVDFPSTQVKAQNWNRLRIYPDSSSSYSVGLWFLALQSSPEFSCAFLPVLNTTP